MTQGSTQGPAQGSTRIYSLISTIFLVLTALTLCGVIGFAVAQAQNGGLGGVAAQPSPFVIPSVTPTLLGPTQPATWTAAPNPTATNTRPATRTPSPSETATPTNTGTATNTMTPSNTPLPTNTPRPTLTPTRGPFDYLVENGAPSYKKNSKFPGCDAVIAGVVKDMNGNQSSQVGMQIHVSQNEADTRVRAGDHTEYGQSGWEYYYNNHTVQRTYALQLEYPDGTIASAVWQITTNADCSLNLTLVNFDQVQSRQ